MKTFDVNVMAELALRRLKSEGGFSSNKFSSIKTIGFRPILKHFESIGNVIVDNDMLRGFLEKQYDNYKGNRKQAWRWQLIRRSTELIMYFAATGRVDLPPLPRWHKRDCQLYIEPTEEQLTNNDNIYGLVWRTRAALGAIGYADRTLRYYDLSGFAKLLDAHRNAGTEIYSRKLSAQLLLDTKKLVDSGKLQRYQAVRKTVALLHEFHQYGSITPEQLIPFDMVLLSPKFEALVEEYGNDALFSEKLSEVTVRSAKSMIKGFLLDLEYAGFFSFDGLALSTVGSVITQTAASHYKCGSAALLHYVRDFLKYLYEYGLVETDLSGAVPKIAAPFRKIYQGFTDDEIRKLLAAVDCNTPMGKRDYAIMMLAAQTGLRKVDILNLKRSDIDWRKREIHITQSKTGETLCLTLEIESGNAICDYILNARKDCDIPNVFLSALYPLRSLRPQTAHGIIAKYMSIAGIKTTARQRYGFHSFRRAFGTRLLESGTTIHLLSQLLGHSDLNSAKPYMSASERGLKECCLSLALNESEGDTQ